MSARPHFPSEPHLGVLFVAALICVGLHCSFFTLALNSSIFIIICMHYGRKGPLCRVETLTKYSGVRHVHAYVRVCLCILAYVLSTDNLRGQYFAVGPQCECICSLLLCQSPCRIHDKTVRWCTSDDVIWTRQGPHIWCEWLGVVGPSVLPRVPEYSNWLIK